MDLVVSRDRMGHQQPAPNSLIHAVMGIAERDLRALHKGCLNIGEHKASESPHVPHAGAEIFRRYPEAFASNLNDRAKRSPHRLQNDRNSGHARRADQPDTHTPGIVHARLHCDDPFFYKVRILYGKTRLFQDLSLAQPDSLKLDPYPRALFRAKKLKQAVFLYI